MVSVYFCFPAFDRALAFPRHASRTLDDVSSRSGDMIDGALVRISSQQATAWIFRAIAWATLAWMLGGKACALLLLAALVTQTAARVLHACRARASVARSVLALAVGGHVLLFASTIESPRWPFAVPIGMGVFMCHAISYLVDVNRGLVDPRHDATALLFLVQLPVFPAGPLWRFNEFRQQLKHTDVTMAGFSYGIRRITTGLIKVLLIAEPLRSTADQIFALRVTRLSTDTAWLGAVCAALDVYFWVSGFSDVGIGLGRIVGFRLQENFRRPFTADSIREFWRRWNVTLMTWLRDYLALPSAGHGRPTVRLFLATVTGMLIVGSWQRTTLQVVPWALYFASWLAIEALGFAAVLQRLPRVVRHIYVLVVVMFGWMLLRATGPGPLVGYIEAMVGLSVMKFGASSVYLTWGFTTSLVCAIIFAGPMVGNISRWRVSVDAATASLIMMLAATGVLMWQAVAGFRRLLSPGDGPNRS